MTAVVDQFTAADPRDVVILDEDGCVIIVPAWAQALHPRAPSVEKLVVMIENVAGRTMAELSPTTVKQWVATLLGGHWDG